jgi:TolB-like protein/class 3 adenylate cyclase/Flp pilus assembly protein TadD
METSDRHLATILFTDIVDSTRRAAELGDRRWRDVLQEHDALVRSEIARHEGREWNTAGDGFLATFEKPESAVRCAAEIREQVHALDLRVRCGLHAGEVQGIGDGIGGIAVHTAARVAALAGPDEVVVSRTVHDLVAGSGLRFRVRGRHELKGVPGTWELYALGDEGSRARPAMRPRTTAIAVAAVAVLALGLLGLYYGTNDTPSAAAATASVAVLPFANASPDPADEYFSDGLTDELISALAEIDDLRVPGRTSSFAFKGRPQDIRTIARELVVAHVVEGSVRRSGDRLRIDARLVNAENGYEVWSETYDRSVADALEIQVAIARSIAAALQVQLLERSIGPRTDRSPAPEAYDAYLRGLHASHAPTEEGVRESVEHYLRAIEIDPQFAQAHAGLAIAYHGLGARYGTDRRILLPLGKASAERAMAIDDALADSHLALALGKAWWDRDYEGAERAFRRALELRPGFAAAHQSIAGFLVYMGRCEEGLASVRRAVTLEPLSTLYATDHGAMTMFCRRYEEAVAIFLRTLERNPEETRAWLLLGRTLTLLERFDEAAEAFARAEGLPGHEAAKVAWGGGYLAAAGRRAEAEARLARLEELGKNQGVRQTDIAALEVALGRLEPAIERIERAERERNLDPVPLQLDPGLDPLRADPRFHAVVERMGLPLLQF